MKLFYCLRIVSYLSAMTGFVVSIGGDDAAATFQIAMAIWLWLLGDEEIRKATGANA